MTATACLICLGAAPPDSADGRYHRACLGRLFGAEHPPRCDLDPASLPERVQDRAAPMSVSGVQRKALMRLSDDRRALLFAEQESTHILKPQERYEHMPENEHVTMLLAALAGLEVPPCGLLPLVDGTLAYVVKRFDRSDAASPAKRQQFDLCQLADRPSEQKYEGSAEACAALVRRYATADPEGSLRRLFALFVASYWLGNGDLHLKNISLYEPELGGGLALTPTYDLLCSQIYFERHEPQALWLSGRRDNLSRGHYLRFAIGHCGMSEAEAAGAIDRVIGAREVALETLARSPLPAKLQRKYAKALSARTNALAWAP